MRVWFAPLPFLLTWSLACGGEEGPLSPDADGATGAERDAGAGEGDGSSAKADASPDGDLGLGDGAGDVGFVSNVPPLRPEQCRLPNADDLPCDDGDDCTTGDRCVAGGCVGSPRICRQESLAPECLNGTVWRIHEEGGFCGPSGCEYGYHDTTCLLGCDLGQCACPLSPWVHQSVVEPDYAGRSPAMVVDDTGGVHLSYLQHTGTDNFADTSIRYAYRNPSTARWTHALVADISTFREFGQTAIALDPTRGEPVIVYQTNNHRAGFATRTNGVWTSSPTFTRFDLMNLAVAVDSQGTIHEVHSNEITSFPTLDRDLIHNTLAVGATTWNSETVSSFGVPNDVFLERDANDGLHAVYRDGSGDASYAYWTPGGLWAATLMPKAAGVETRDVSSSIDGSGAVHLALLRRDVMDAHSIDHAVRQPGGAWTKTLLGAPPSFGELADLFEEPSGVLHVAFVDTTDGSLDYGRRSAAGMWSFSTIDPVPGPLDQISLVVDDFGGAHASFSDAAGVAVKYGYRPPGGVWMVQPVGTKETGSDTEVVVDSDGGVHLFYYTVAGIRFRELFRAMGASTWTETGISSRNVQGTVEAVVDAAGGVHVAFTVASSYVDYAYRPALGTWTVDESLAVTDDGHFAFAVDSNLVAHIIAGYGGPTLSHTSGVSGGAFVTSPVGEELAPLGPPTALIDGAGALHVAFSDDSGLKHLVRPSGRDWYVTGVGALQVGPRMASSPAPNDAVSVVFYDELASGFARAHRSSGGMWAIEAVGPSGHERPIIAADVSGGLHLGQGSSYAFRPASGAWVSTTLGPEAANGTVFALEADALGNVHAGYGQGGIQYASNAMCP